MSNANCASLIASYVVEPEEEKLLTIRTNNAITFACEYPIRHVGALKFEVHSQLSSGLQVQVILRLYQSPGD